MRTTGGRRAKPGNPPGGRPGHRQPGQPPGAIHLRPGSPGICGRGEGPARRRSPRCPAVPDRTKPRRSPGSVLQPMLAVAGYLDRHARPARDRTDQAGEGCRPEVVACAREPRPHLQAAAGEITQLLEDYERRGEPLPSGGRAHHPGPAGRRVDGPGGPKIMPGLLTDTVVTVHDGPQHLVLTPEYFPSGCASVTTKAPVRREVKRNEGRSKRDVADDSGGHQQ